MAAEITSRERVQGVLNGGLPDRLLFNFWMDRDSMAKYDEIWGADFRLTHYAADVVEAFAIMPFWSDIPVKTFDDGKTVWQLEPLVETLKAALDLELPDPRNPAIYADIESKRAAYPDKAIWALFLAPLAILEPLRLAENLFIELYDSPDEIHTLLGKIKPLLKDCAWRICQMDIDVLYLAGDICGRDGAMVSPKHLREFNFDYLKEIIDLAHEFGKKVFYHSDGKIMQVIDIFIEYGIDGCNPLEPRYNDGVEFMERFGDKIMLYGGGDNCNAIPNGTPDEVRAHVRQQFETFGKNGRYIFSTHDIPSYCPIENLDAMVDEIKNCVY